MGIKNLFFSLIIVIGIYGADYKVNDVGKHLFDYFFPYQLGGSRKIAIVRGFAEGNTINYIKKSVVNYLNATGDPNSIDNYKIQFFSKLNMTPCSYNMTPRSCRLGNSINRKKKIADLKVACNVYTIISDGDLCNTIKSDIGYIDDLLKSYREIPCLILIDPLVFDNFIVNKIRALCDNSNNSIKIFGNALTIKQNVNVSKKCLNISDRNAGWFFFGRIIFFLGIFECFVKIASY